MHPRNIHYTCDICLLIPFIGILMSVFFSLTNFKTDILTIEEIFKEWKIKPIHIIQSSRSKKCEELGMYNILNYNWPGTTSGCLCNNNNNDNNNKKILYKNSCNENQFRQRCINIESVNSYNMNKWKDHFLCGMTTMKNFKNYFDFVRIKENDFCAYKTKKCGRIDTLNYYLCIPENENCPINDINYISNEDNFFELSSNNNNVNNGNIYISFILSEEKLCVNHKLKNLIYENKYQLMNQSLNMIKSCNVFNRNGSKIENDKNYKLFDSYSKKVFYEQNEFFHHIKKLPLYPEIKSKIGLYGNVYTGWKKDCEKKEFFNFYNNYTEAKKEIDDILFIDEKYQFYLFLLTSLLVLIFIFGIYFLKYKLILTTGNKVEVTTFSFFITSLFYLFISLICCVLIYFSQLNLNVIKKANLSNKFFDLIANNNCSDERTNFILRYISEEFFSYINKYFNIKALGIFEIGISLIIIFYTYFAKRGLDKKRDKKEKQYTFYKFD